CCSLCLLFFFFQAEDGIRDFHVTGVQTCALPISFRHGSSAGAGPVQRPRVPPLLRRTPRAVRVSMTDRSPSCPVRHCTNNNPRRSEERRVGKSSDTGAAGVSNKQGREYRNTRYTK